MNLLDKLDRLTIIARPLVPVLQGFFRLIEWLIDLPLRIFDMPATATVYQPDTDGTFKEVITVDAKLKLTPEAEAKEVAELERLAKL